MNEGTLYGIGVGPGDPELMTLKSIRIINECDVLFLPAKSRNDCIAYKIASQAISGLDAKEYICREFPMTRDESIMRAEHEEILALLKYELDKGRKIAFLTIGDPSIYSTYAYMQTRLIRKGYKVETISGVTSFCAAAARLGIPLANGTEDIHIISGYKQREDETDTSENDVNKSGSKHEHPGTRIYMKTGRHLLKLLDSLKEETKKKPLSIHVVSECGMEQERAFEIKADTIITEEDLGYMTVVIVKE